MTTEPHRYANDPGDLLDVQPGDIWTVGPHLVACGDLELGDHHRIISRLPDHPAATPYTIPAVTYNDPPWNQGLATGFRTKAGDPHKVHFDTLLGMIVDACNLAARDCFIEMGAQHLMGLRSYMAQWGIGVRETWEITYARRNAAYLVRGQLDGPDRRAWIGDSFDGMDDLNTPFHAIRQATKAGEWVWDPCLGRGLTAVSADQTGRRCVGMELSPRRLAVTISKLMDRGHAAVKVDELRRA